MTKKDCVFQYATGDGKVLEDTELLTREEGDKLWQKHVPIFRQHLEEGGEQRILSFVMVICTELRRCNYVRYL